jgi:hypothetical protein
MIFVFFATGMWCHNPYMMTFLKGAASIAVIVNPEKDTTAVVIVAIGQVCGKCRCSFL